MGGPRRDVDRGHRVRAPTAEALQDSSAFLVSSDKRNPDTLASRCPVRRPHPQRWNRGRSSLIVAARLVADRGWLQPDAGVYPSFDASPSPGEIGKPE